jgi:predicted amidophosphoribosyltransferase
MRRSGSPAAPVGRALARVAAVARDLERWLLPPACLLCDEPVPAREGDALVCGLCRTRWRRVPAPVCDRCGTPATLPECGVCRAWPPALARVRSAVWLEGPARDAVHELKYGGWWRAAEPMAEAMLGLAPLTGGVCLIPIPLGRARRRSRGYNQSEALAAALGRLTASPVRTDVLTRPRETPTQTALPPEARRANVAGAFAARWPRLGDGAPGEFRRPVLVDDVFTTGATLAAGAAALAAAGAPPADAVTFARTPAG